MIFGQETNGWGEGDAYEGFSNKELCEIAIPNVKKSFGTYHPRYLYSKGINGKIFSKITK